MFYRKILIVHLHLLHLFLHQTSCLLSSSEFIVSCHHFVFFILNKLIILSFPRAVGRFRGGHRLPGALHPGGAGPHVVVLAALLHRGMTAILDPEEHVFMLGHTSHPLRLKVLFSFSRS